MIIDQSSMKISKFVEIKVEDLRTDGGISSQFYESKFPCDKCNAVQEIIFLVFITK